MSEVVLASAVVKVTLNLHGIFVKPA